MASTRQDFHQATTASFVTSSRLLLPVRQFLAGAFDAGAGFAQDLGRCRVGDAEIGAEAETRALHHGDAFAFEQVFGEVFVGDPMVFPSGVLRPMVPAQEG